jgi:hypothetical protein
MYPTPNATSQSTDEKQTKPPSPTQIYPDEPREENKVKMTLGIQNVLN